jgi:hypothetical protein
VVNAEIVACPQFPTTLPTLDEIIGLDGVTAESAHEPLLERTAADPRDHVFTLHAELEGMKLAGTLEKLVEGWESQGYQVVALREIVAGTPRESLPMHSVVDAPIAGRSGTLATQGPEFLAPLSGESSL